MRSSMVGYPSAFLGSWSIVNPVGNIKGHVGSALDLESYKYYEKGLAENIGTRPRVPLRMEP